MKKYRLALFLLIVSFIGFYSCTKINEATELGGDLIPAVDNVNTFEKVFATSSNNVGMHDTTNLFYSDQVAVGVLNDPVFGNTKTDLYFTISSSVYGRYPFNMDRAYANNPDSLRIDSVILSLSYTGYYGDTNSQISVSVAEIAQAATFNDDTLYRFTENTTGVFLTTGSAVNKNFAIKDLNDSVPFIRKRETTKTGNVLRIALDPELGRRFANFDTALNSNGGFRNDSIFKTLFKGFAVQSQTAGGNGGLAFFNLASPNTKLTVYFTATKNAVKDTNFVDFFHSTNGQANIINRSPNGSAYGSALANGPGADPEIYIQSAPGSYGAFHIPALDTFSNKVIHRAELIATKVGPSLNEMIFTAPPRIFLDRFNDTAAFILNNDLPVSGDGSINFPVFGGQDRPDKRYVFNITRHVQGIVTRNEPNDSLRLYAPLRTFVYSKNLGTGIFVPVLSRIADGRVVLGGGNYTDSASRLRVRIIYSNL